MNGNRMNGYTTESMVLGKCSIYISGKCGINWLFIRRRAWV